MRLWGPSVIVKKIDGKDAGVRGTESHAYLLPGEHTLEVKLMRIQGYHLLCGAAGFNSQSTSAKIVDAVKQGQLRMVWNDATRREIERIMRQIPPLRAHAFAELFRPQDRLTAVTHPERFADVPDRDDRKFAALAHATGAVMISNDEHLLRYRGRMDLTVLTPTMFWQQRSNITPPG